MSLPSDSRRLDVSVVADPWETDEAMETQRAKSGRDPMASVGLVSGGGESHLTVGGPSWTALMVLGLVTRTGMDVWKRDLEAQLDNLPWLRLQMFLWYQMPPRNTATTTKRIGSRQRGSSGSGLAKRRCKTIRQVAPRYTRRRASLVPAGSGRSAAVRLEESKE